MSDDMQEYLEAAHDREARRRRAAARTRAEAAAAEADKRREAAWAARDAEQHDRWLLGLSPGRRAFLGPKNRQRLQELEFAQWASVRFPEITAICDTFRLWANTYGVEPDRLWPIAGWTLEVVDAPSEIESIQDPDSRFARNIEHPMLSVTCILAQPVAAKAPTHIAGLTQYTTRAAYSPPPEYGRYSTILPNPERSAIPLRHVVHQIDDDRFDRRIHWLKSRIAEEWLIKYPQFPWPQA